MKFAAILMASMLGLSGHAHAQGADWKIATGYAPELFHTQNIDEFARAVRTATNGQLRLQLHANNTLVPLAQIPQAVRDSKSEVGEMIMTNLVKDIPIAGADAVPFVVGSYADARKLWRWQRPLIEKHFEKHGFKVLFAVPWPPQGLYTTEPVKGVGGLRGAKMRTYNSTTKRIAELMGASPVEVTLANLPQAMERGEINTMITSAVTGVDVKAWRHMKHYYEIYAWIPKNIVFANLTAFQKLPAPLQQTVVEIAAAAEVRGWDRSEVVARTSTDALRANGMKIDTAPAEFSNELKRLGEKFSLEWIRTVGPEANSVFIPYYTQ